MRTKPNIPKVVTKSEIRRLQKAAREADKNHLADWMHQYNDYIYELMRKEFEKAYEEDLAYSIDNFLIALLYALKYTPELDSQVLNLDAFMEDLVVCVDMFKRGEYSPIEYMQDLSDDGVHYFDDLLEKRKKEEQENDTNGKENI